MAKYNKYNSKIETLLVTLLAKGATVAQAARQAVVSERTVYRRRQQPEFQARVQAIQDEIRVRTTSVLVAAAQDSVRVLVDLLGTKHPAAVRRAAARDILDRSLRAREVAELDIRLSELEQMATASETNAAPTAFPTTTTTAPPPARTAFKTRRGDTMLQAALASGNSVAQAAATAKLSERTVYRRLKETAFQRAILSLRAEAVERTSALLNAASVLATKTLIELLHESIPPTVRRGASRDIIVLGGKTYEQVIQDKRLTALEQSLNEQPLETPWRLAS